MDWASRTWMQTTVTPAWTNPGYDPREADASPGVQTEEEEEPKKKKTFQKSEQTENGQWRYCTTEHLHFVYFFVVFFEHYVRPEAKRIIMSCVHLHWIAVKVRREDVNFNILHADLPLASTINDSGIFSHLYRLFQNPKRGFFTQSYWCINSSSVLMQNWVHLCISNSCSLALIPYFSNIASTSSVPWLFPSCRNNPVMKFDLLSFVAQKLIHCTSFIPQRGSWTS